MRKQTVIHFMQKHSQEIKERFGIHEILLFGSVVRDEAQDTSDIDLIVDFEGTADFDRYMGLRFFLEDQLGVKIDLVTRKALKPAMREAIEREAIHVA